MVNLVTFHNNRIRFVILSPSSSLKSPILSIYIFNDSFYFVAPISKSSLYCNPYSNDISRRISVLNLNYYEIFKKDYQNYLLSKVNKLFFT